APGLSQGESWGMAGLSVPRGAQPADAAGHLRSFPSIDVSRVIPHPRDLPHQLIQLIVMGPVLAVARRASSGAEQSSPAWEWLMSLPVPAELSTGGTWECTA
ncbi:unnamed protein product, partial [Bubo scandiacus]